MVHVNQFLPLGNCSDENRLAKTAGLIIIFLAHFFKQQVLGGKEGGSTSRNCAGVGRTIIECKAPKKYDPDNLFLSKRYTDTYSFEHFSFMFFLFRLLLSSVWDYVLNSGATLPHFYFTD